MSPSPPNTANDAELLGVIATASRAEDVREAQAVFYERHVRYLYAVVTRHKRTLLSVAGIGAEDLVQETFHRAFERARTFEDAPHLDADRRRQRARAWLGRIAQNLLADRLADVREVSASPYLERVTCEGIDDEPPSTRSPAARLLAEGLEQLTERERDILRVSALHYHAGDHQRLPNDVSAELAGRWNTTNDNIRAIRVRAMKKLKEFVLAHQAGGGEAS
jgi:RNA polymerase sigma factor (sigma-70 family)